MTDCELRGLVLQAFYDRRKSNRPEKPSAKWVESTSVEDREIFRICGLLSQHDLIKWHSVIGKGGGHGTITAQGIDVVEGNKKSDVAIQLSNNYTTNISGSTNVIVGDHNKQEVGAAFEELLRAIDSYAGSVSEKEKSKSLLAQLTKSPIFAQVVGQLTRFGLEHVAT